MMPDACVTPICDVQGCIRDHSEPDPDPIQAIMEKMQAENRHYLQVRALHAQYGPQLHDALDTLMGSLEGRDPKSFSKATRDAINSAGVILDEINRIERGLQESRG